MFLAQVKSYDLRQKRKNSLQNNILNQYPFSADLFDGSKVSDCLLPCLRTVATVKQGTKIEWDGTSEEEFLEQDTITKREGNLVFSLTFNDEVKVKKTSVDKFSFMDSFNFFGSNLGLWPGLGLYQILEWMVGIFLVSQILKKIRLIFTMFLKTFFILIKLLSSAGGDGD